MNNQEAVNLVRHMESPQEASECLAKEALTRMSKGSISCLVVRFEDLQTKSSYAVTFFSLFLLRNGDSKEKGREDFFGALTAVGVSSCEMRFFSVETSMEGAE